jgi:hypothetical protein
MATRKKTNSYNGLDANGIRYQVLEYTIFDDTPASGSKEYALASGRAVKQLSATEFEITSDGTLITVGESATNRRPLREPEPTPTRGAKRRTARTASTDQKRAISKGRNDPKNRGPRKKR